MAKSKKEVAVIETVAITSITNVNPKDLKEFKGWEQKQIELVKENPLVEIVDNSTYQLAKKSRTALKSGRTALTGQDKEIASKLSQFRKAVGSATKELIEISLVAETNQQTEIDRWEKKKAEEKAAEEKRKAEELNKLHETVAEVIAKANGIVDNMTFETIDAHRSDFDTWCDDLPMELFENPVLMLNEKLATVDQRFEDKVESLEKAEADRIRAEELKKAEEKMAKEKEKMAKEKAEAKKKAKEQQEKEKENIRKGKLLDCKLLRQEQVEYLISAGYIQTNTNIWKQEGDMISVAILNEDVNPVLGFSTMEELREHVQNEEKLRADRIEAEKKAEAEALAKKEKAQENIDNAVAEVKIDEIEVIAPYTFPTDLGIDSDIEMLIRRISNVRSKIDLVLGDDEFKTDEIRNIQANLHQDLFIMLNNYEEELNKIQKAKSIAE